jgi:hypothetical protein
MKKVTISALLAISLFSVHLSALDMGSMLKSAAPIVAGSLAETPTAQNNSLVSSLSSSLGVTPTQAIGGTAVLLNSAKNKMQPLQYSELTKQTPGLGDILSSGSTASLLSSASVANQFEALGMNSSMVSQFAPIILNYAKGYVSPEIATALSAALSF